jgi:hypothetical protein
MSRGKSTYVCPRAIPAPALVPGPRRKSACVQPAPARSAAARAAARQLPCCNRCRAQGGWARRQQPACKRHGGRGTGAGVCCRRVRALTAVAAPLATRALLCSHARAYDRRMRFCRTLAPLWAVPQRNTPRAHSTLAPDSLRLATRRRWLRNAERSVCARRRCAGGRVQRRRRAAQRRRRGREQPGALAPPPFAHEAVDVNISWQLAARMRLGSALPSGPAPPGRGSGAARRAHGVARRPRYRLRWPCVAGRVRVAGPEGHGPPGTGKLARKRRRCAARKPRRCLAAGLAAPRGEARVAACDTACRF